MNLHNKNNNNRYKAASLGALNILSILSAGTVLSALPAQAQPEVPNLPGTFAIEADDVTYAAGNSEVVAQGNVNITSEKGSVWADKLIYNSRTGTIVAEGNVIFVDPEETTIFIDRLELNEELKMGVIEQLRIRLGGEGAPALAAERAEKIDEHNLSLVNAVYSPCQTCKGMEDKNLPWKIRAGKITYNSDKKQVSYRNAVLDIYGVPVIYLPYFRHPVGDQTAQNGLIPPRFARSTNRGEETTLGYYMRHSDHSDTTLRTRLMTARGAMLQVENRYVGKNFQGETRASVLHDSGRNNLLRSHLELKNEYVIDKGKRIGIAGTISSDDTYLDDFMEKNEAYHSMSAYAEHTSPSHYYALTTTWYQDIQEGRDPGKTAQTLPRFVLDKSINLKKPGQRINISAEGLSLHRGEGRKVNRLVTQIGYSQPWITNDGNVLKVNANVRGDIYHIDAVNPADNEGVEMRVLPEMSLSWERPMISSGGNHRITPKAMVVLAPRGGNKQDIPNEDSVAYELDTSNLFDTNRFAGYDRVETGTRFIAGVDNHWGGVNKTRWRVFLGQSYRLFDDAALPALGGTSTKLSDWVGNVEAHPLNWLSFTSAFRLDNANLEARRMDNTATIGDVNESYMQFTHSLLDGGPEEINATARINLNDKFSFETSARKDLTDDGKLLSSEGSVIYTQHCYRLSFTARRRGYENRDVPPSTDYLFNIELLTLGRDRD